MKIFTIENGDVRMGAEVIQTTISGKNFPTIVVGEVGRGRKKGMLRVYLLPESQKALEEKKTVTIFHAELSLNSLVEREGSGVTNKNGADDCLCVFRTMIGFRGGNSHTGDRIGSLCEKCQGRNEKKEKGKCTNCGGNTRNIFGDFPGEVLVEGQIAQGAAGAMGSGAQIIARIPRSIVFRTGYSGRLYGAPKAHYYIFIDGDVLSSTWEERTQTDIF